MVYSPIPLFEYVEVDIPSAKNYAYLEVIDSIGDKYPYTTLLDIVWAFKNYAVVDLKRDTMNFEVDGMHNIQPLDPY